jgi:cell wall assembly regulator SMI1
MTKIKADQLSYKGESIGVHSWTTPSGQPYYWHPDWLHIAEDATGSHPKQKIDVEQDQAPTEKHAVSAILKHLNQWATDKLASHPDIETSSIEAEINLKK